MEEPEVQVIQTLRSAARNEQFKHQMQQSNELYPLLLKAAKRYVTGEERPEAITSAKQLISKSYNISLEFIGENTKDIEECQKAKNEFLYLIKEMGSLAMKQTVSLDLSHIGLSVNPELAYSHLLELAHKANFYGIMLMVSMEESTKTNDIIDIYKKASTIYPNVGITIQAHLYRTDMDIKELMQYPGKIRLVKGAFQESTDIAMKRSKELNERYLNFVEQLIEENHPVSIATHDELLIQEMEERQYFEHPCVEIEMLYGIRPDLLSSLKNKGYNCKVYLLYGKDWHLYLCHRLAEYPKNLYLAVTDIINPSLSGSGELY